MSYQKHHTDAFVLRVYCAGDADVDCILLTPEDGVVRARAQSARTLRSRHRYALHEYAHCHVSLVRGRAVWRITNVSPRANMLRGLSSDARVATARLSRLVLRLVTGEEHIQDLFDIVMRGITLFRTEDRRTVEAITVARILHALGYFVHTGPYRDVMGADDTRALSSASRLSSILVRDINDALVASQL